MEGLSVSAFIDTEHPILDVRSPAEFKNGHIPGANNLPLFNNDEREEIGTIYKQQSRELAIKRGLELVGPKMRSFIEKAEELKSKTIHIHCWRGGMRSQSMAWLLGTYGFKTEVLEGGYKAFRQNILEFFKQDLKLKILTGHTGSMKTQVLLKLRELGEQVIDLEGLAGHQGSSFGNVLSQGQPSTEHFQNLIYREARVFDILRPIWLEDESYVIGKVALIEPLFRKMQESPHILIEIPEKERVRHLVNGYGNIETSDLVKATQGIGKKLGSLWTKEAIDHIERDELTEAAKIILTYYDKQYKKALNAKQEFIKERYRFEHTDIETIARHLRHGNR